MKFNKVLLIVTSVLILLPILVGVVTWDILPEKMATHFGISGEADGFGSRVFAVFGFPVILLIFHWLCIFASRFDKSNKDQNKKAYNMVLWITPLISWFCSGMIYALAFGIEFDIYSLMAGLFGVMFLVIGNYMPKIKHNHTLGIKISWTLESEENWNATHRMSGKLWFVFGLLALACVFVPYRVSMFVLPALMIVAIAVPIIYSYRFHQKEKKEGKTFMKNKNLRKYHIISGIIVGVILAAVGFIMFSGDIDITYTEDGFTLDSMYGSPKTIKYSEITGVWYTTESIKGAKVAGFSSAKLMVGKFKNEALGTYDRYTYTGNNGFVVVETENEKGELKYTVFGAQSFEKTEEIYNSKFKSMGSFELSYTEDGFTLDSMYGSQKTIKYSDITGVWYTDEYIQGAKVAGFSSAKLMVGKFKNEALGTYDRYTYTGNNGFVVVETENEKGELKYTVFGAQSFEKTEEIYNSKFKSMGSYELSYTEDGFTIIPSHGTPLEVKYTEVGSTQYREGFIDGEKKSGFESNELMMGVYSNEEFGTYKRYTSLSNDAYVIVELIKGEDTLEYIVLNADSLEATRELYNELTDKIAG